MAPDSSPPAGNGTAIDTAILPAGGFAAALIADNAAAWRDYTRHAFVRQLGDGSLPEAAFRHYLIQDYIFLKHFSRAYALAAFKSDSLEDLRQSAATLDALINGETKLHVEYCRDWGLEEAGMAATPEAQENMAYTRFVLEKGLSGDLLDLLVALAPCVIGYADIGLRLTGELGEKLVDNPYRNWIETYSGSDYLEVVQGAVAQIDRVAEARLGAEAARDPRSAPRWESLSGVFGAATRLEVDFWGMGYREAGVRPPQA